MSIISPETHRASAAANRSSATNSLVPAHVPDVHRAVSELRALAEQVGTRLDELRNRLSPVLHVAAGKMAPGPECVRVDSATPLASNLIGVAEILRETDAVLDDLFARLEV